MPRRLILSAPNVPTWSGQLARVKALHDALDLAVHDCPCKRLGCVVCCHLMDAGDALREAETAAAAIVTTDGKGWPP